MSSDEVMGYEANGGYNPREIYEQDADIRRVMDQMVDGTYSNGDTETFRELFNSLINQDVYFILKDFRSYAEARAKINEAYRDSKPGTEWPFSIRHAPASSPLTEPLKSM